MNREQEERRILDLVKGAVAEAERNPSNREAYVKLIVAHDAIERNNATWPGSAVEMMREILGVSPSVALFYTIAISRELSNIQAHLDDIAQGEPFEYDGMSLQAWPVK